MENKELTWYRVCDADKLEMDDVICINIEDKTYAVYLIKKGYFATDGLCTHENVELCGGYVDGEIVECPKHNAQFHIPSGEKKRRPARGNLQTYPAKKEGDGIFIGL